MEMNEYEAERILKKMQREEEEKKQLKRYQLFELAFAGLIVSIIAITVWIFNSTARKLDNKIEQLQEYKKVIHHQKDSLVNLIYKYQS